MIVAGQRLAEGRPPAVRSWPRTLAGVGDGSRTPAAQPDRIVEVAFDVNVGLLPDALAPHGDVVVYGMGAREVTIPAGALMLRNNRLLMILVYELLPADRRAALEDLTRMLSDDQLLHNVALRCPLSVVAAAHEAVERGTLIGNVVLDIA